MTAPTHISFAVTLGLLNGSSITQLIILSIGSLLPDLDYPRSYIGMILRPISHYFNNRYGHRQLIHGFPIYIGVFCLGYLLNQNWICLLTLGALSHIVLDLMNKSGVSALSPFSEGVCVILNDRLRIRVGSTIEITIMTFLIVFGCFGSGYIYSVGGVRNFIGIAIKDYDMAITHYRKKGNQECELKGKLRMHNGQIKDGEYLIIGFEGKRGNDIAILKNNKIIHIPEDASFLTAILNCKDEYWQTTKIRGTVRTKTNVFYYSNYMWKYAKSGSLISGNIIGKNLNFEEINILKEFDISEDMLKYLDLK